MIAPVHAPCLLVAMPNMLDSNFSQAVILLAEHNPEGAIGFVLNRPSTVSLKAMISILDREVPEAIPAWYGGPVDTTTAIILHDQKPSQGDSEIAPGINLSTTGKVLDSLIDFGAEQLDRLQRKNNQVVDDSSSKESSLIFKNHPFRFLVGYAGWGAHQLDDEIRSGAWLICPLDRKLVFDTPWAELWNECMGRVGVEKNSMMMMPQTSSGQAYLN
jgi:putative transcriptional regulator